MITAVMFHRILKKLKDWYLLVGDHKNGLWPRPYKAEYRNKHSLSPYWKTVAVPVGFIL